MQDLEGLLVISVEQAVAAPYASARLADAGARVIKVERPDGDFARRYDDYVNGQSAYFVWLNRGKESVCLDLKSPQDRALLASMIGKADVFLQNLAPGAIDRLGLAPDTLRRSHPRLIVCSISGYGATGPFRDQKAYDLLVQAESGLCAVNGAEDEPARVGVSVCDIAAGMTAFQGILQALFARERGGEGRIIDVSLFHAMADWMNVPYLQHRYGGVTPGRHGLKHPTIAPYGAYPCADGKLLLIAVQNEREWQRLCADILDDAALAVRPGFSSNRERVENRAAVDRAVGGALAMRDREVNSRRLADAGIAYGRLSDLDDLAAHPQNQFICIKTENGPVELLAPGSVVSGRQERYGAVPSLNEHGDRIRSEFG